MMTVTFVRMMFVRQEPAPTPITLLSAMTSCIATVPIHVLAVRAQYTLVIPVAEQLLSVTKAQVHVTNALG